MDFAWLAGVTGFALAMAATPGPNNTLAAASGTSYGLARSLPLMAGIAIGVTGIMLVAAAFGTSLIAEPSIGSGLKWAGVAYLLWLAWRIATAEPADPSTAATANRKPLSFFQGAFLQVVNPKLWIMVSGAIVTYGQTAGEIEKYTLAALLAIISGSTNFIGTLSWALLGASIRRFLKSRRRLRLFNAAMATLLVASLIPVIFE